MKRLHLSINVSDLEQSIRFYSDLFGAVPTFMKDDYTKWMLDDTRVNLVLEHSTQSTGVTHAGIQVDNDAQLREMFRQMQTAEMPCMREGMTTCCYAQSEKSWTFDPDGLPWEAFITHRQLETRNGTAGASCC